MHVLDIKHGYPKTRRDLKKFEILPQGTLDKFVDEESSGGILTMVLTSPQNSGAQK